MPCILAFDQGTTSSRSILYNQDGKAIATAQKEFRQLFPRSGWVEHDASEIWSTQISVASDVLSQANITAREVLAIGITNQRETTVVWNRHSGQPVSNAIVWQDRRTAGLCRTLRDQGYESTIREKTGLVLDPYFSATKLHWILNHVSGVREEAERGNLLFGTIDSWLVWNLTEGKVHVTDSSNASRTMLYNIHEERWDPELLELFEIPESMLPEVRESSEVYGNTGTNLFAQPIPIAGIAGDQQAALFGQVCTEPGMTKNTYGTGCFMLMQTGQVPIPSHNNLLTTIAWKRDGQVHYALEGSIFIGGAVVQWLRDGLGIIRSSAEVEPLARSVPDTDGVYLVPAFSGLGAPHWDPFARGTIVGITRGTKAAHIARAALEAIAYQSRDLLQAMESDSGLPLKELRVDGGASANNLLMQFQSDLLGVPVVRPTITETTALGAAALAGLAIGFWQDTEEIQRNWKMEHCFEPAMDPEKRTRLVRGWSRAVERAKGWAEENEGDA